MNSLNPMNVGSTSRAATLARGIAAIAAMLLLTLGVPALLVTLVGNPLTSNWSWTTRLSNEALLDLTAILAWIFWTQMVVCLLVEILAEVRIAAGRSAQWMSTIPGTFSTQQVLARALVQTIVAIGIGTTAIATAPMAGVARADSPPPDQHTSPAISTDPVTETPHRQITESLKEYSDPPNATASPARHTQATATHQVTVAKGDSLWSMAERHLGAGERWRSIAALNRGRLMPDGQRFVEASSLQPGWTLLLPAAPSGNGSHSVVVEPGETLWSLAQENYGDGQQWPWIFEANHATISDPDLIHPGQQLRIPQPRTSHPPAGTGYDPTGPGGDAGTSSPRAEAGSTTALGPTPTPIPEPATSATGPGAAGDPKAEPRPEQPSAAQDEVEATIVRGLVGGGALLAAGVSAAFFARRRHQFRNRRSGRTIAATPPELLATERAVRSLGSAGGAAARFLDEALRDLALAARESGFALPNIVAARLAEDELELLVSDRTEPAPAPWRRSPDGLRWTLPRDAESAKPAHQERGGALAPYPTLVAIGLDSGGSTWLLDLEAAGILQLLGDTSACTDLARFIAAELATNSWSDAVDIIVTGVAAELVPLNPCRLETAECPDIDRLIKAARRTREATEVTGHDVLAGRVDGAGGDTWMPTILVANAPLADPPTDPQSTLPGLGDLSDELLRSGPRSTVALVTVGVAVQLDTVQLTLDADGQITTPWSTELRANSLRAAEARAVIEHVKSAEDAGDEPMPPAFGVKPYDELTDVAGALRPEFTEPRDGERSSGSLLPDPDATYLDAAATTSEDLEALAPSVPKATRAQTVVADPELDADLAEWSSPTIRRPRLKLLGAVEVQVAGERPPDVTRRPAYYPEMVAYLATRPQGASPQQMAAAFQVQPNTMHSRIGTLRKWLGMDQVTGAWHLPESTLTEAGRSRGVPVYQLTGLLCDFDLFRRLRLRGTGRGGEGISDLIAALKLVNGPPFDQLRPAGYGWLAEIPLDHYVTAGIVDVAHIVATHGLASGNGRLAMWAAQQAVSAAPSEDTPRLDLAAAMAALGDGDGSGRYVAQEILNRSDDDDPPPAPTPRTARVLGLG